MTSFLKYKAFDVLNKKAIIIVGYVLLCYVIEGAELGKVLKKRAFQTGIIQAAGKEMQLSSNVPSTRRERNRSNPNKVI